MGAAIFADDIILLSLYDSNVEDYASEHNLNFSVDPNPAKSKSKAIYMCGTLTNVDYTDNLQLYDHVLPWVQQANHL